MRAISSICAAAALAVVVALTAPSGGAAAESPSAAAPGPRAANGCPERPRIHVRRYGQRGGGAPTRCPPTG